MKNNQTVKVLYNGKVVTLKRFEAETLYRAIRNARGFGRSTLIAGSLYEELRKIVEPLIKKERISDTLT